MLLSTLIAFALISWGYCTLVSATTSSWMHIFGEIDYPPKFEENVNF
jgi:hypothetical protein